PHLLHHRSHRHPGVRHHAGVPGDVPGPSRPTRPLHARQRHAGDRVDSNAGADPRRPHVPQRAGVVEDQDGGAAAQRLRATGHRQAVQLAGDLSRRRRQVRHRRRQDAPRRDARAGQQGRARPSAVAGRHPQLLRAPVPHEAGRGARARDRAVVRGDQDRQVRAAVRRAVWLRPLRHARLDLRAHAGRVHEVGGGEPDRVRPGGPRREGGRGGEAGRPRRAEDGRKGQAMSAPTATAHAHTTYEHHELGFVRTYIFSTDHKMIPRQFLFLGLIMMVLGGVLALVVRWQLAWPETAVPGLGGILKETGGILEPTTYNMAFTMHATIMIFFVIMPILAGAFGNFCIPLMIGARDMAFPLLNMLSFWVTATAGVIMLSGFFVEGGHAAAGWTSYVPLSAVPAYTGVNWGQNLWCISLFTMGIGSMMGSINYITTIINMRAPGMKLFRMPLVIWSLFITAILLLLALPVLTSGVAMLLFDRTLGTNWFKPAGGGEPLLWQHLFWYFGHPEVYILILPAMGIASALLPVFCRKPIFGYHAMAFSMIGIAFLSWIVYGHHMFVSGMNPALGMAFTVTTMIIAVPSAIKTFNWLGTMWGARMQFTVPMLNTLAFV